MTRYVEVELDLGEFRDNELIEELEGRGFTVPKEDGQIVIESGLTDEEVLRAYHAYNWPLADQPALDLWKAAQGEVA